MDEPISVIALPLFTLFIGLDPYPMVRAWLARVEQLPQFEPMAGSPLPIS